MSERIHLLPDYEIKSLVEALSVGQKSDWGRELIGAKSFYDKTKGAGVKVCVIDTGAPYNHPDLEGAIIDTFNAYENEYPLDRVKHGGHVASIIGARDNAIGTVGIAPECSLLIAKGLDDSGFGEWDRIAACIQWAVSKEADIINLSLGDPNEPPEVIKSAINWATSKGILIVCAAGNDPSASFDHPTNKDVAYPARYDEAIAVAALDKKKKLAYFSHRGKSLDSIAPGVDVYGIYGSNYAVLSGTSQAAPIVSGILALLKAYKPESIKNYKDAIRELQKISIDQELLTEYTGNYNVGIPTFANITVQSVNNKVELNVDPEIVEDFEDFDFRWDHQYLVSENQEIVWDG